MLNVAILIDGGFFIKRYGYLKNINIFDTMTPDMLADELCRAVKKHVKENQERLYRIIYYDCEPYEKKQHNPISKKLTDFSKSRQTFFMKCFHDELRKKRLTAIRLGYLHEEGWQIKRQVQDELFKNKRDWNSLTEDDVRYSLKQKGIDIKIGTDIASIAYKKLAQKIVLISGDSDFVPAAKLARREGIDFVLDPMWAQIKPDLHEHIDGLKSCFPRPAAR